ncbi:unnamed protein product [Rotaria magnacalcarata]|uniref:EF-hand domain-containing protein n=2 Tax=Rotaria magnacalcarata TaxID=392030 RepID=A0A819L193_9BILA|nr:unnamed protein product [Rotaria magnacalcarata]CAF3953642.1 unnamed protein product [Rotaria magnacalcarata]
MAKFDAAKALFRQIDTNKDGSIDKNEFLAWMSNAEALALSNEASVSGHIVHDNVTSRFDQNGYRTSTQNDLQSITGINASCGTATSFNDRVARAKQSNLHLSKSVNCIYKDPNPQIIRRAAAEGPLTYQQKVLVRFLQPPALPPPGPLIIKEVRPPQPPPPPPLRIRQAAPNLPQPPPLILRERPPLPPAQIPAQTVTRRLPPIPVPPRSIIVERYPTCPQKPRDIIIERWIPYGPPVQRRTVIQRAPAPVKYTQPRNYVIVYEPVQARVIRQFRRIGVNKEDPEAYKARYGSTLLDSPTLVRVARNAGVIEDISPPTVSSPTYKGTNENNLDSNQLSRTISGSFISSGTNNAHGIPSIRGNQAVNYSNTTYSSLPNLMGDNALARSATTSNAGFAAGGANFAKGNKNHNGILNQAEFQQFIKSHN